MSPEFPTPAMVLGTSKLEAVVQTIHFCGGHATPKMANPQKHEESAHFHNMCFGLPLQTSAVTGNAATRFMGKSQKGY